MTEATDEPAPDGRRADAERHLRALVGRDDARLRDDQWRAIETLAARRRRALVVQRTGWGKSAVYFVATLLLRSAGAGPTVIISPLLALMRNQIEAAQRAGIRAVTVNSTNAEQWQETYAAINAGQVDVLLVSPERLNNPGFRDEVLPSLAATCGLLVVDEAHCISDWGHDFRPDYRRIKTLLDDLPDGIPVLATTATANARVTDDVADQLGTETVVLRGTLDRASLRLGVVRLKTAQQRLAWLADHLAEQPGSGIVYCLTVAATTEVAEYLRSQGLDVAAYSGQTPTGEREALEADLAAGRVKALAATSALGMGFDATLGFVVNLGAPASPVAYYQQVGRAGRGTDEATVVLLPATEDRDIWAYFGSLAFPAETVVRTVLAELAAAGRPLSTAALETAVELNRSRLEMMLKVLDVDGAVKRVKGGWTATGASWTYDADRYHDLADARKREQQAMLDYLDTNRCRMRYLRDELDDPEADDCGRCDNCGGLALPADVSEAAVAAAQERLDRPGSPVLPRKMWPTGLEALGLDLKGRIKQPVAEGRVVASLTDLGFGPALRDLFALDEDGYAFDCAVPTPLVSAVLDVLSAWEPAARGGLDGIVVVESASRPTLSADLAAGVSRRLGIPVVGRFAVADPSIPPGRGAANSAQRIAAVDARMRLDLDADVTGRSVLLVDDQIVTGWTVTLAGDRLAAAGAAAVHPLALASQS